MKKVLFNDNEGQQDFFVQSEEELLSNSNEIEITDEYLQGIRLLNLGNPVVFFSGPGGVGKTILIDHMRKKSKRNFAVVAPTGVAALNAQGQTIHSFFRFPFGMVSDDDIRNISSAMVANLSLLIIDEISMVRADTMDAIDKSLRKARKSEEAFGGVQLLLVGDLFQLPPVVPSSEVKILKQLGYKSPYFFDAKVFERCPIVIQNLTKVYRQSDVRFIEYLNKLRVGEDLDEVIPAVNQRYVKLPDSSKGMVTLTCTNKLAEYINYEELKSIKEKVTNFVGEITGQFRLDEAHLPAPMNLSLKIGAQVMFTKNDSGKRWVNGTIGRVVELDDTIIKVEILDGDVVDVPKEKYSAPRNLDHGIGIIKV